MSNRIVLLLGKLITYIVIVVITVQASHLLYLQYAEPTGSSFNILVYQFVEPIVMILCGVMLGYEKIITSVRKTGKWRIDVSRFMLLALPIIVISFQMSIYYSSLSVLRLLGDFLFGIGIKGNVLIVIQILAGLLIVSCVDKVDSEKVKKS